MYIYSNHYDRKLLDIQVATYRGCSMQRRLCANTSPLLFTNSHLYGTKRFLMYNFCMKQHADSTLLPRIIFLTTIFDYNKKLIFEV
uniref:Uncharacterized protein n=1 Tax=Hordeum vulgare subsp. vulgare TaxID=112509 RepID=A0A8I6YCL8_HORVV